MKNLRKALIIPLILKKLMISVLIPPICGIVEGKDTLFDKVRILGGEFFCIKASNDAEEGQIALDIFAPFVLTQAEAKDLIKLCLRLG